jgi:hypothetical protein
MTFSALFDKLAGRKLGFGRFQYGRDWSRQIVPSLKSPTDNYIERMEKHKQWLEL